MNDYDLYKLDTLEYGDSDNECKHCGEPCEHNFCDEYCLMMEYDYDDEKI